MGDIGKMVKHCGTRDWGVVTKVDSSGADVVRWGDRKWGSRHYGDIRGDTRLFTVTWLTDYMGEGMWETTETRFDIEFDGDELAQSSWMRDTHE
jgi:hypothetical protein